MTKILNGTLPLRALTVGLMCLLVDFNVQQANALDNNLQIGGTLVSEPCTLDVNDNTLLVDFGTVLDNTLYKDTRTLGLPFRVTLTDCDTSLAKSVNLTFSGQESVALPGLLITSGSGATGIAIGIETLDGVALPVNHPTPSYDLQDGTTAINLQAYVQAEPKALEQHSLVPGSFSAVATIDASYP